MSSSHYCHVTFETLLKKKIRSENVSFICTILGMHMYYSGSYKRYFPQYIHVDIPSISFVGMNSLWVREREKQRLINGPTS